MGPMAIILISLCLFRVIWIWTMTPRIDGVMGVYLTYPTSFVLGAVLGTLLVTLLRFACHIVSGAVIWYALDLEWYADDPDHIVHKYGAWMFSTIYNGTFMLPEIIETVIGVPLLTKALSKVNMNQ